MKKKEGRVDDGPVDESFIGSSPHTAVAGAAAAVAKCREAIIIVRPLQEYGGADESN